MTALSEMNCVSVEHGAVPVPEGEIAGLLQQAPGWEIVTEGGEQRLRRVFKFRNFREALDFTNQAGELAEQQNHHPALLTEWGRVTVTWWTHTLHGLHMNDFIMAAKTDRL